MFKYMSKDVKCYLNLDINLKPEYRRKNDLV